MPPYPDSAGNTFDRIAEAFDATRASPWPFVKDWLAGLGPIGTPLVDVGCGNGRHLTLAATLGKRGPAGTGLVTGDARQLPLPDNVAAAVIAVAMLHHVPTEEGRRAVASELKRIALPGGPVLVSVWALDDPEVAARARARPDPDGDPRDLLVPWRAVEGSPVDRFYRVIGLAVVRAWDVGPNHVVHARKAVP